MNTVMRPEPSQQFVRYLNAQFSPRFLGRELRSLSNESLWRRVEIATEQESIRQARRRRQYYYRHPHRYLWTQLNLLIGRYKRTHPRTYLTATFFGSHYDVIDRLRNVYDVTSDPQDILLVGAGLHRWRTLYEAMPVLRPHDYDSRCDDGGISYAMAELALLGNVDVIDFDKNVVEGISRSLHEPVVINRFQLLQKGHHLRSSIENGDEHAVAWHQGWLDYVDSFIRRAAQEVEGIYAKTRDVPFPHMSDSEILHGHRLRLRDEIASRANVIHDDIRTHKLTKQYDLAWLTNVGYYIGEPLWWSVLVRAINSLPVAKANGARGGLLVVDTFGKKKSSWLHRQAKGRSGEFLTLTGMMLHERIYSPFYQRDIIIAERTHASPWLDKKIVTLKEYDLI
jgi:hypothetical protein